MFNKQKAELSLDRFGFKIREKSVGRENNERERERERGKTKEKREIGVKTCVECLRELSAEERVEIDSWMI